MYGQEFTGPIEQEVGELLQDGEVNTCTELFGAVGCNLAANWNHLGEFKKLLLLRPYPQTG